MSVVSERIGQFFIEGNRLEFTEYGGGERHVVLLHGQMIPRRMHHHVARSLAEAGNHVITLDLLGHGRSDRPADPAAYSMTAFATQVVALLDHLGIDQAVVGGTSLGANVSLECAVLAPDRVRGLLVEMPVLENALHAGIVAFVPVMFAARYVPFTVRLARALTRPVPRGLVPFWAGVVLDTFDQQPEAVAAMLHGVIFGRIAPPARQRCVISVPALVIGHARDVVHPLADAQMLAEELPHATFVTASSPLEWRMTPDRLTEAAVDFIDLCWAERVRPASRRVRRR